MKQTTREIACTDLNGNKFVVTEIELKSQTMLKYLYEPEGFIKKFETQQAAVDAYNQKHSPKPEEPKNE